MQVCLETERLILRRFTEEDAGLLVELDSDPEVMLYLSGGSATPREVIEREVLPRFLRSYEWGEGYGYWAAIEKGSGAFLGWIGFNPHGDGAPGEVSLGYRLRRVAWGQGYAAEGARAPVMCNAGPLAGKRRAQRGARRPAPAGSATYLRAIRESQLASQAPFSRIYLARPG